VLLEELKMRKIVVIILAFWLLYFACSKNTGSSQNLTENSNANSNSLKKYDDSLAQETEPMFFEAYPPSRVEAMEAEEQSLNQIKSNTDALTYQSFRSGQKIWNPGQTVTVAFNGGSFELRQQIENAVKAWTNVTNIKFDFRNPSQSSTFREWTTFDSAYRADIRIAFESQDQSGFYWSAIGKESIRDFCNPNSIARSCYFPNQSSMNLGGFTTNLPNDWEATVLHEFGHALGFLHEHQSFSGTCENEFNWDRVYSYFAGQDPPWDKTKVDFNLKKFTRETDMIFSEFDKKSIMKYYFQRWMFADINVSRQSGCYSDLNLTLSEQDKIAAADAYPRSSASIQKVINERVKSSKIVLKIKNLPTTIKKEINENIKVIKNQK
jgi:hypothetical protein